MRVLRMLVCTLAYSRSKDAVIDAFERNNGCMRAAHQQVEALPAHAQCMRQGPQMAYKQRLLLGLCRGERLPETQLRPASDAACCATQALPAASISFAALQCREEVLHAQRWWWAVFLLRVHHRCTAVSRCAPRTMPCQAQWRRARTAACCGHAAQLPPQVSPSPEVSRSSNQVEARAPMLSGSSHSNNSLELAECHTGQRFDTLLPQGGSTAG